MLPRHSGKSSHSETREYVFLKEKPCYPQLHVCTAQCTKTASLAWLYLLLFMTKYELRKKEIMKKEQV